jgi:hypothetical protein
MLASWRIVKEEIEFDSSRGKNPILQNLRNASNSRGRKIFMNKEKIYVLGNFNRCCF